MDTISQLIAARAHVDAGWARFVVDDGSRVCALGGLRRVMSPLLMATETAAYRALKAALPEGHHAIGVFNDDHRTTKQDVLALFDRAIAAEAVKVSPDPAHTYQVAS